jgi:hypothetical protein
MDQSARQDKTGQDKTRQDKAGWLAGWRSAESIERGTCPIHFFIYFFCPPVRLDVEE